MLIKGGTVVDGTGRPGERADVRTVGDRISEVGPSLSATAGEEVIDASDAVVTPGFVDSHTHYDASLFWDPRCDPMPRHGVTTVLIGNCSLSMAPLPKGRREELGALFAFVEDIPAGLFTDSIPWNWASYGDYAREMAARPLGVNVAALVGHSMLRLDAMGDEAWERPATEKEIAHMQAGLRAALDHGAFGLSTSLIHKDPAGRMVPSAQATDEEFDHLYETLGSARAIMEMVPNHMVLGKVEESYQTFGERGRRFGVPTLVNSISDPARDPKIAWTRLSLARDLQAAGAPLYPMLSPRSTELQVNFHQTMVFLSFPAWNEMIQASADQKRRILADPAWRARAREDWDTKESILFPTRKPENLRIVSVGEREDLAHLMSKSLADLVAAKGGHPSDVLADWLIETDLEAQFVYPVSNLDPEVVGRLAQAPEVLLGVSDAGAHLQMFAGSGDTTLLLTRHVRDRGDLTLEQAVHGLTGRQAAVLGLKDRGRIAPGKAADLVVFRLEDLRYEREQQVKDLPGGRPRFTRPPGGYRYTIANGQVVQAEGVSTEALSGRFLGPADRAPAERLNSRLMSHLA